MTDPALGRSKPVITASNVDLPDPDGPAIARVSPTSTFRSTPRKMLTAPAALAKVRATPRNRTKGSLGVLGMPEKVTMKPILDEF